MIGVSPSYAQRELEEAIRTVKWIGARYEILQTDEMKDENYTRNPVNRCYFCKTELFGKLKEWAVQKGYGVVADGTNRDDLDDYRPGLKAISEQNVRSPLREADLTKSEIRELSKNLGLSTWDKPAVPCLSSRFPYGFQITEEALRRVDAAETFLAQLGFREVRVRHYQDTARIEVAKGEISRLLDPLVRDKVVVHLKKIGYAFITVDLDGFRSGNLNRTIPPKNFLPISFES
jgi:uncharacterized protein